MLLLQLGRKERMLLFFHETSECKICPENMLAPRYKISADIKSTLTFQ